MQAATGAVQCTLLKCVTWSLSQVLSQYLSCRCYSSVTVLQRTAF